MIRPLLGIVAGVEGEKRALGRWLVDPRVAIALSGADAGRARQAAADLAGRGARVLVSFGLAGGLDPSLRPGTVIRPKRVSRDGTPADWSVRAANDGVEIERLVEAAAIVATSSEKAALAARAEAQAVDMESAAVAEIAASRGLTAAVLRAIADPAERDLPQAALVATRPDGAVNVPAVLGSLIRRPSEFPALLALGRDAAAGTRSLMRLAKTEIPALLAMAKHT